MSISLRNILYEAVTGHGLTASRVGEEILVGDGLLRLELHTRERPAEHEGHIVQLDVLARSIRLGERPLIESFAGFGATPEEAGNQAFGKFLRASFHVLIEALADHSCENDQGEWDHWQEPDRAWKVCSGPLLVQHSQTDATAVHSPYTGFSEHLEALFRREAPPGAHWVRVFICAFDGAVQTVEVLLDNDTWPAGEALAGSIDWATPQAYTTLRHFLLALPEAACAA